MKTVDFVRFIFWLLIAVSGAGVGSQTRIIHGDTIDVGGARYRIHGIDAPESAQQCGFARGPLACGKAATVQMKNWLKAGR